MPTEADRSRAVFAQENARGYYRAMWGAADRTEAEWYQLRTAHHYATARALMGIEEYPL